MQDWFQQTTLHLLNTAGYDLVTNNPLDFRVRNMRDRVAGTLRRTVPASDQFHVQGGEGDMTLLVLHRGDDDTRRSLYRATLRLTGEDPTVDVERIDLGRRVINVTVREEQPSATGVLTSRWHFEFEGTKSLDIDHEQVSPNGGSLRGSYAFGRAVAEAAGWAPESSGAT